MENRNFEIEKTFGLGVLLQLTPKSVRGIKRSAQGSRFFSNVSKILFRRAVDTTLKTHNIKLKCG